MAILFAGNEPESFSYSGTVVFATTAGKFQSANQRGAHVTDVSSLLKSEKFVPPTDEIWLRVYMVSIASNTESNVVIDFLNGAGSSVFSIWRSGTNLLAYYYNGVNSSNSLGSAAAAPVIFTGYTDIRISGMGTNAGVYEMYRDGSLVTSGTADFTHVTGIAQVAFGRGVGAGSQASRIHWSEIIVADKSTIGHVLHTIPATSDGANTAWTGTYADIDEAAINDADFISGAADGDIETFKGAGRTLTGFEVKAVIVAARALRDVTGPQNLKGVVRVGGANYDSAGTVTPSVAFVGYSFMWTVDPSTGVKWSPSVAGGVNLEFGVKALT